MPILFPNSKSSIIGLSNKVSIISKISLVPEWQVKMFFLKIACTKIPVHQCTYLVHNDSSTFKIPAFK